MTADPLVVQLRDYIHNTDDVHLRIRAADEIERLQHDVTRSMNRNVADMAEIEQLRVALSKRAMSIEVRNDDKGQLDEIVGQGCYVHLERMDDHWFCLIVEDGKRRLLVNIGTPHKSRHKVNATIYADEEVDEDGKCRN